MSEMDDGIGSSSKAHVMHRTLEDVERPHILSTLKDTGWMVSGPNGAANRLGFYRST